MSNSVAYGRARPGTPPTDVLEPVANVPDASGTLFAAFGPTSWGTGDSVDQAIRAAEEHRRGGDIPGGVREWDVYEIPVGTEISVYGSRFSMDPPDDGPDVRLVRRIDGNGNAMALPTVRGKAVLPS